MVVPWEKFYEIQLRLKGAKDQLSRLNRIMGEPPPTELIEVSPVLDAEHFLQSSFDLIGADIRHRIGLFAYELRSALNYMTVQLAEHDSDCIGRNVQFPIDDDRETFMRHQAAYLEGLSAEHVSFIEALQPYHAGRDWMRLIRDLSNMDKHRGLIKVNKKVHILMNRDLHPNFAFEDGSPILARLEAIHARVTDLIERYRVLNP
jgi:hypothetical protein